ncbi:uncharacterized protein BX664DRAFT_260654 [Halteromyces radiatus]|uniref:uncharacterized protein n=1 Tax=Halteromyces radiatus TaxID=101107 RepID=UPI00222015CA|nr:uncharacterized protein BX664DRAFT_260654 [Halteromyces radiatus]KAI8092551.1 hypothetical protein BX664DRAFT_260654 [Halteromyces radiatus]
MSSLQYSLLPPPSSPDDASISGLGTSKSRFSIASFSLTHDKDAIKTYRRMANKTNNKDVQMTYCKYLLQVADLYQSKGDNKKKPTTADLTRQRLLEEAEYWVEKLAASGHPEALYMKGMWHASNDHDCVGLIYQGINHEKAFKCLRAAAKRGWMDASYQVARYWRDRGDYKKTLACYKTAAHQGHVLANYKMARILLRGQLQQKINIKQGLEYLKSAADDPSDDSAQAAYDLSCVYSDNVEAIGMERDCLASRKNVGMAMHYLVKSQQSGWIDAYYQLGIVYEQGALDQPCDLTKAFEYYTKAAEDGHAQAMLALSRFYSQGIPGLSIPPHPSLAFKWCQRAASYGLTQAEYTLG